MKNETGGRGRDLRSASEPINRVGARSTEWNNNDVLIYETNLEPQPRPSNDGPAQHALARPSLHSRPAQHQADHGVDRAAEAIHPAGAVMSSMGQRELVRARLAQLDIEAVALALKHDIVSPEQAAALFWNSEAVRFLGLDIGDRQ
jgi:hypothetical protein